MATSNEPGDDRCDLLVAGSGAAGLAAAVTGGRSLIAIPYDGRGLGVEIRRMRAALPETSFWGMTIQAGPDLKAFLSATRSVRSAP